jgi:hypothetical protein
MFAFRLIRDFQCCWKDYRYGDRCMYPLVPGCKVLESRRNYRLMGKKTSAATFHASWTSDEITSNLTKISAVEPRRSSARATGLILFFERNWEKHHSVQHFNLSFVKCNANQNFYSAVCTKCSFSDFRNAVSGYTNKHSVLQSSQHLAIICVSRLK